MIIKAFVVSGILHLILLIVSFSIQRTETQRPVMDLSFIMSEEQEVAHSGNSGASHEPVTGSRDALPARQTETPLPASEPYAGLDRISEEEAGPLPDEAKTPVIDAEYAEMSADNSPGNASFMPAVSLSGTDESVTGSSFTGYMAAGKKGGAGSGFSIEGFMSHVESIKWYPSAARRRGIEGTVLLRLKLDKYGELIGVNVKESSGYDILDMAALSLLRKACPFKHGMEKVVDIEVPVTYALVRL